MCEHYRLGQESTNWKLNWLTNNILIHILIGCLQASHITYLEFSDKCNDKH